MDDLTQLAQRRRVTAKPIRHRRQPLGHLRIGRHHRLAQIIEVGLGARIQKRRQQGNANRTAKVAQNVEQARCRPRVLRQDVRRGDQGNRHHNQRLPQRPDNLNLIELRPGKIRVEHSRRKTRQTKQSKPQRAQPFRRNDLHQLRHQRNQKQLRHAHPHDHFADLQGVVVLDLRQVQRQQINRAVQPDTHAQTGNTR